MARNTEPERKNVSAAIPKPLWDALEDHRWKERMKMSEILVTALSDYTAKHRIKVAGGAPADEAAGTPEQKAPAPNKA